MTHGPIDPATCDRWLLATGGLLLALLAALMCCSAKKDMFRQDEGVSIVLNPENVRRRWMMVRRFSHGHMERIAEAHVLVELLGIFDVFSWGSVLSTFMQSHQQRVQEAAYSRPPMLGVHFCVLPPLRLRFGFFASPRATGQLEPLRLGTDPVDNCPVRGPFHGAACGGQTPQPKRSPVRKSGEGPVAEEATRPEDPKKASWVEDSFFRWSRELNTFAFWE